MIDGWWYRVTSVAGTFTLSVVAANVAFVTVDAPASAWSMTASSAVIGGVVGLSSLALYRPRPRRPAALLSAIGVRIAAAGLVLLVLGTTIGPTELTPRVVTATSVTLGATLLPFYWVLNRRPNPRRVLVVGDDIELLETVADDLPVEPLGFASPRIDPETETSPTVRTGPDATPDRTEVTPVTDGSGSVTVSPYDGRVSVAGLDRIGGLTKLHSLVKDYDVDTLALGFRAADRGEFFGAIKLARELGMDVLAHESVADSVVVRDRYNGSLVSVTADPWPWYVHVSKRAFDICFALVGLLALTPLSLVIATAIKVDSPGPILYEQRRTSAFGGQFRLMKFRTMIPESDDPIPQEDGENDSITGVGHVLRKTHADEIPQLWSVLVGDMSVVGPRAIWTDEERLLECEVDGWRARWLVKPGLTGLAQVNDVTSTAGQRKLELDLEYVRTQSLLLDVTIALEQIRIVLADVGELTHQRIRNRTS